MASEKEDSSNFEAVTRRRKRGTAFSRRTEQQDMESADDGDLPRKSDTQNRLLNERDVLKPQGTCEDQVSSAQKDREKDLSKDIAENAVDNQLMGNLGSVRNDYGVIEELIPQIDFDVIPFTQPKRVLAKIDSNAKADSGVFADLGKDPKKTTKETLKRKKKPVSLLDSYFKGL